MFSHYSLSVDNRWRKSGALSSRHPVHQASTAVVSWTWSSRGLVFWKFFSYVFKPLYNLGPFTARPSRPLRRIYAESFVFFGPIRALPIPASRPRAYRFRMRAAGGALICKPTTNSPNLSISHVATFATICNHQP